MITVKRIRKAPTYVTTCPVCHTRIAPQGAIRAHHNRCRK